MLKQYELNKNKKRIFAEILFYVILGLIISELSNFYFL
ncbi:hypothetical protein ATCC19435_1660 [Lactococcus lactis subsp. lactis]|nr:hypothetical protein ATCC19435_1660 [Lactococcus lactis subsp. lactis]